MNARDRERLSIERVNIWIRQKLDELDEIEISIAQEQPEDPTSLMLALDGIIVTVDSFVVHIGLKNMSAEIKTIKDRIYGLKRMLQKSSIYQYSG